MGEFLSKKNLVSFLLLSILILVFSFVKLKDLTLDFISQSLTQTAYAQEACTDDVTYCDTNIHKYVHKHGGYWDEGQGKCIYAFDVGGDCGGGGSSSAPPPATCSNGTKRVGEKWGECHGCDEREITCIGQDQYDSRSVRNPSPVCGSGCVESAPPPSLVTCSNGLHKLGESWPECHGCDEGTVTCIGQDQYSDFHVAKSNSSVCGAGCGRVVPTPLPLLPNCPQQRDPPYGQCGNTYGLEGRDPNLTFEVTRVRDCYGNIIRYENDGGRHGRECDNRVASPTLAPVTTVTGINIDDIDVSFDNLSRGWKINLPGQKDRDQVFTIPIKIRYSDQTTRYVYFIFNYHAAKLFPTLAPTLAPTSSPTPVPTPTAAPTFIPTPTPISKEVTRVTINGEDVDINHLKGSGFRMTVDQNTISGGTASLPILVEFNDGSIKSTVFKLRFSSPPEPPAPAGLPFTKVTPSPVAEPNLIPIMPPTPTSSPTPTPSPSPTPAPTKIPLSGRVIIDPGHGVPDLDEGKTEEARANLAVARRLQQLLEADAISTALTHNLSLNISSHYQDLQTRVDIINQSGAQLFIAIHFDSGNYPFSRGPRAYYNSSRPFSSANRRLAELVSSAISRTTNSSLNGNIGRAEILEDIRAGACCGPLYLLGPQGVRTTETRSESEIRRASAIPGILTEYFTVGVSYSDTLNNAALIEQIVKGYKEGIEQFLRETY